VTLVVGLVCRLSKRGTPAAILAGDGRSAEPAGESGNRIAVLPGSSVLAAGVGSLSLTGKAIEALGAALPRPLARDEAVLSCDGFDALMWQTIAPSMRRIVLLHEKTVRESGFGLLLAFSDKEDVRLYAVQSDGVPFRVGRGPGHGCLARGYSMAGGMRFNQFRTEDLPPRRAGRLAAFMILGLSMVDASVGKDPEIFETVGGTAKPWDEDPLRLARERVRAWDESLDRSWGLLSSREADFGVAAIDSLMNRKPVEALPKIARRRVEERKATPVLRQQA